MILHSATETQGKKFEGGDICSYGIYLTKQLPWIWKSHFPVVVFLPADRQNWINFSFCFACKHSFCFYDEIVIGLIHEFQLSSIFLSITNKREVSETEIGSLTHQGQSIRS